MDFSTILSRITDLPETFLRFDDTVFDSWEISQAFQLSEFCTTVDALVPMLTFSSSAFGWLNVWGELLGIPRNPSEADSSYLARIQQTLQNPVGTPDGIAIYSTFYWGATTTVTENLPLVGYVINLPPGIDPTQIPQYLISLERIRPAGVPFTLSQGSEFTFLRTFRYLAGARDAGAYLGGQNSELSVSIPEPIDNSQPILPMLLISDPLLNGRG